MIIGCLETILIIRPIQAFSFLFVFLFLHLGWLTWALVSGVWWLLGVEVGVICALVASYLLRISNLERDIYSSGCVG